MTLIETIEDPEHRRNKIAFLTEKGKMVAYKVLRIIDPKLSAPNTDLFPSARDHIAGYRRSFGGAR